METSDARIEAFWRWVESVMAEQHITFHALEQQAGVANAAVWKRARNRLPPTPNTYDALSQALQIPKRQLMERAGDLPSHEAADSIFAEFQAMGRRLTPDELTTVIRFMRFQFPEKFNDIDTP